MNSTTPDDSVTCGNCDAACCRLQVLLICDNPLPERLIEWSEWGGQVMRRLADGWCAGLDRDTMRCTIYAQRPQICRDFAMGGNECLEERGSNLATAPKIAADEHRKE